MENLESSIQEKNEIVIELNEAIKDMDGIELVGQNAKGDIVILTYREALKWVISSMPIEYHCNFDYLALGQKYVGILSNEKNLRHIISKEDIELLKPIVQTCRTINSLPKMALLNKFQIL